MCRLVPQLNESGWKTNGPGKGVHALLALLVLVAVQQTGDESGEWSRPLISKGSR